MLHGAYSPRGRFHVFQVPHGHEIAKAIFARRNPHLPANAENAVPFHNLFRHESKTAITSLFESWRWLIRGKDAHGEFPIPRRKNYRQILFTGAILQRLKRLETRMIFTEVVELRGHVT